MDGNTAKSAFTTYFILSGSFWSLVYKNEKTKVSSIRLKLFSKFITFIIASVWLHLTGAQNLHNDQRNRNHRNAWSCNWKYVQSSWGAKSWSRSSVIRHLNAYALALRLSLCTQVVPLRVCAESMTFFFAPLHKQILTPFKYVTTPCVVCCDKRL